MYKKILTVVAVGMVSTSLFAVNSTNSTFPSDNKKVITNTGDPIGKPGMFQNKDATSPKNSAAYPRNTPSTTEGMQKRDISSEYPVKRTPIAPEGPAGVLKQPTNLYPNTSANPTTEPQK